MLGLMERDLPGEATRFVPTVTQLGYALGLFLLLPLGDLIERKRLIVGQFVVLALALAATAVAPGAALVIVASLIVGISLRWRSRSSPSPPIWPRPGSAARPWAWSCPASYAAYC
jgi:MFS family permease